MSCDKSNPTKQGPAQPDPVRPGEAPVPDRNAAAAKSAQNTRTAQAARAERLAAELRANLKRRKASQRGRSAVEGGGIQADAGDEGANSEPPED